MKYQERSTRLLPSLNICHEGSLGSWLAEGTEQKVKLPHVGFYHLSHSPCPDPLLLHASLKTIPASHVWSHHTHRCTSEPNAATERVSEACFGPRGRFTQCQAQAIVHFWRELTTPRGLGHADIWASPLLFLLNTTCWALTAATECLFWMNDPCMASNTWCSRPTTKSHFCYESADLQYKKNHFRGF